MRKIRPYGFRLLCWVFILLIGTGCNRISEPKYNIQDYQTEEDSSLYNFTGQLSEMENVLVTAMYEEDRILICQDVMEEEQCCRKIWLFSYLTGEKTLCSELIVPTGSQEQVSSYRFSVLGTKPFVLCDMYRDKIYIYTDDFSDYSTVSLEDNAMPIKMVARPDGFYFMDFNTCKVYKHDMMEFASVAKDYDYKTFREESQLIFVPDYNTGSFYLEGVSEDGNHLRLFAENLEDNEYYYYLYNVQTKVYEEIYQLDYNKSVMWNAWEEDKYLNEVVPSAVSRYEMMDYSQKRRYTVKIEPQVVYHSVQCDTNIADKQDCILFYVVDENTELITELFLWDYTKAESGESDAVPAKKIRELPAEIDYAYLTDKAEVLEEKYGINIILGENVNCDFEAYEYKQVTDEERISAALDELQLALDAFPDGMCAEMCTDYAVGFNVYLCGEFTPRDKDNISDAGAFFVFENGYNNLAMNIMLDNTESNVIHEMTHAIDNYFVQCGASEQLEADWQACNPEDFTYHQSYFGYEELYEHTYADDYESVNDIYFIDTYSCTFPGEDRSRVFEFFGSEYCKEDWLLESKPLQRKARLLLDYCGEYLECFGEDEGYGLKQKAEERGW